MTLSPRGHEVSGRFPPVTYPLLCGAHARQVVAPAVASLAGLLSLGHPRANVPVQVRMSACYTEGLLVADTVILEGYKRGGNNACNSLTA